MPGGSMTRRNTNLDNQRLGRLILTSSLMIVFLLVAGLLTYRWVLRVDV